MNFYGVVNKEDNNKFTKESDKYNNKTNEIYRKTYY